MSKKRSRIIDWTDREDMRCVVLGALGFSTRMIQGRCGNLSNCQVAYRLRKAHVKRTDYRNGTNFVARRIMRDVTTWTAEQLERRLRA